jgi:hypothetical protein
MALMPSNTPQSKNKGKTPSTTPSPQQLPPLKTAAPKMPKISSTSTSMGLLLRQLTFLQAVVRPALKV